MSKIDLAEELSVSSHTMLKTMQWRSFSSESWAMSNSVTFALEQRVSRTILSKESIGSVMIRIKLVEALLMTFSASRFGVKFQSEEERREDCPRPPRWALELGQR